jgi:hypothetical protein
MEDEKTERKYVAIDSTNHRTDYALFVAVATTNDKMVSPNKMHKPSRLKWEKDLGLFFRGLDPSEISFCRYDRHDLGSYQEAERLALVLPHLLKPFTNSRVGFIPFEIYLDKQLDKDSLLQARRAAASAIGGNAVDHPILSFPKKGERRGRRKNSTRLLGVAELLVNSLNRAYEIGMDIPEELRRREVFPIYKG